MPFILFNFLILPMLNVRLLDSTPDLSFYELVERKGLGHPDTVIDAIMESISMKLSREYLSQFGRIYHHNVDKGLIVGGEASVNFNSAELLKPIEIYMAGRATSKIGNSIINVEGLAMETAREYLERNFPNLDVDEDVILIPKICTGAANLSHTTNREVPVANDTSFGVGFAPYTPLEQIVLDLETHLNSPSSKTRFPFLGEDIKVMGLREGDRIKLIVAAAFVSKHLSDIKDYIEGKEKLLEYIRTFVTSKFPGFDLEISLNTSDDYKQGLVYITKTGLSMEHGDDGEVGRGNRASGLITPYRQMSLEATAGKNPVNHVGKIYSVLANAITRDIIKQYDFVENAELVLLSQIGMPINEPLLTDLKVVLSKGYTLDQVRNKLEYIVDSWLENIDEITEMIVYGRAKLY